MDTRQINRIALGRTIGVFIGYLIVLGLLVWGMGAWPNIVGPIVLMIVLILFFKVEYASQRIRVISQFAQNHFADEGMRSFNRNRNESKRMADKQESEIEPIGGKDE